MSANTTTRPRRVIASAANTPVAVEVNNVQSIGNDEAQELLTQFLEASENSLENGSNTNIATAISQLKRCQRELRGLMPLSLDSVEGANYKNTAPGQDSSSVPNKKIKFDDEGVIREDQEEEEEEEQQTQTGAKISKEERNRLKKERRKEEKKNKKSEE